MKFGILQLEDGVNRWLSMFKLQHLSIASDDIKRIALKEDTVKVVRPQSKASILIVDNEPNMLNLLFSFLSKDFNLILKQSPIEAILWLEDGNTPSLIITEYNHHHFSGAQFINYVKASGFHQSIPIIVLSGAHDIETEINTHSFEIDAVVAKPFDPVYLKDNIKFILNEYEPAIID